MVRTFKKIDGDSGTRTYTETISKEELLRNKVLIQANLDEVNAELAELEK